MVLQLIVLLLIVAIAAFFAFVEGFYSATVMAVCSVLAALISLSFFEPLAATLAGAMPAYADGISLGLLFAVTLAVLRILADRFLGGAVQTPPAAERIGGGVMGLFNGMVVIGMLVVCLRLLPFGPRLIDLQQVTGISGDGRIQAASLWLNPDGLALGLVDLASGGSLSAGRKFSSVHPDFVAEQAGFNNFPSGTAVPYVKDLLTPVTTTMPDGGKLSGLAIRADIAAAAIPEELRSSDAVQARTRFVGVLLCPRAVEGEDGVILGPTQAQLTCRKQGPGEQPAAVLAPLWLVDGSDWPTGRWNRFALDKAWRAKPDAGKPRPIGLVYALPKDWEPLYLTVRKNTRTELTAPPVNPPQTE